MLLDLNSCDLVVFDVDGTLYDQSKLRRKMGRMLLANCLTKGGFSTIQILRSYRKWREDLADGEVEAFEGVLTKRLADRYKRSEADISQLVSSWMEVKPLPFLRECRFPGVEAVFARIRQAGKRIGILSDYPAHDKLAALGLEADVIVSARDEEVDILKPNPRGLLRIMALAGADAGATVMVGDRAERDGEIGRRAGVRTLLLNDEPLPGWTCFKAYSEIFDDPPKAKGAQG